MKKRTLHLLLLIFGVGVGIGLVASWSGLMARFSTQPVAAQEQAIAEGVSKEDSASGSPKQVSAKDVSKEDDIPSSTIASATLADQLVQELNSRAAQQAIQELNAGTASGVWLHIHWMETFDQDAPNNGVLPNGMAIPNQRVSDTWYHVDSQGAVIESVSIMRTMDGKIVQVGVASKGTGWNSATGAADPEKYSSQEQFDLDQGFSDAGFLRQDLMWLEKDGNTATIEDLSLPNGHAGVEVTISITNSAPIKTVDYEKPSVKTEFRATFDTVTGYLVSREETVWFVDGSQRKFSQLTQEITVEPPTDEVLGYLAQKDSEVTK